MHHARCFRALTAVPLALALSSLAGAQTVDIVGGSSNLANTTNVAKGNSYEVTTSTTLTRAEFELDFTGPQTLTFTVHECPVEFGPYSLIYQSSALVNGVGNTWYSSGAISVPLAAGMHYIVAVSWDGNMNYFYDVGDSLAVSFGSYTHGYAIGSNPLPAQFSSFTNDLAIYYQRLTTQSGPVLTTYCTAGTTSNGCAASISGAGTPSASSGSGFTLQVTSVEGQKQGILFYGIDNSGFVPTTWGQSTSFLCVKHPSQRTGVQNSGGTFGMCDGTLALDWNAYIATHASALGNPFAAGQHVFAQAWFRDPPSPKSTMLSNALEFTVGP